MRLSDHESETPRVLVVDDEASIRQVMVRKLRLMGCAVHEAVDGPSALDHLAADTYHLVVCDIMLPSGDGVSILKAVEPTVSNTQVVMVSGMGHLATAIQTLRLGAFDYLTKPFKLEEFEDCIQRALARGRLNAARSEYLEELQAQMDTYRAELDDQRDSFDTLLQFAAEAMMGSGPHDEGLRRHAEHVARTAERIARQMGLDAESVRMVRMAALLHDIGKSTVDEAVLNKPRELTAPEFEQIKTHPDRAAKLIRPFEPLRDVADFVRAHHEWFDGSGYPDGKAGHNIPLGARILSVADVYEALTSDRCYRPAVSQQEALHIVRSRTGKQFDPWVVDALLQVVEAGVTRKAG